MEKKDPIISFLLEEEIVSEKLLESVLETQAQSGKSLVNVLKSMELIDDDKFTKLVAKTNDIEFITLSPDDIDPVAVKLVSFEIAFQHNLIPVRIEKDNLYVAMSSPLNLSVRDTITTRTGYSVVPLAATRESINQAISYHFNVESMTKQDIVAMRLKSSGEKKDAQKAKGPSAEVADAPIVRLVESIITGAIGAGASDIHIEPHSPDMRVRYRIDGILQEALDIPSSAQREVVSHIKVLADMDISERRVPQDGHISIEHNGKDYDLRISSLPATSGEKIVIRILDASGGLMKLEDIVSSEDDLKRFRTLISQPYGIILLVGPTGSGKTTTLYSMIQELNKPQRNIVTVEDPVEYRLNGITQVQVKKDVGMTFASGLRSILRQDPDVVLIGEIRDLETAEIAISAALTGHLVLSTLHTNDASGAISRLLNIGVPPFQLSSALLGAVAQRLVRAVCPKCKEEYSPDDDERAILGDAAGKKLWKGKGCDYCRGLGYKGRRGLYEILMLDNDIKKMIVNGTSDVEIKEHAIASGMKTIKMQGVSQIQQGQTTLEEVMRFADMRED